MMVLLKNKTHKILRHYSLMVPVRVYMCFGGDAT